MAYERCPSCTSSDEVLQLTNTGISTKPKHFSLSMPKWTHPSDACMCRSPLCIFQVPCQTGCIAARARLSGAVGAVAQQSGTLLATIAAAACLCVGAAHAEAVAGVARVIDGDTLEVAGERLRLFGVDAPESKQLCTARSGKQYACGVHEAQ
jgi:hypothetical protein